VFVLITNNCKHRDIPVSRFDNSAPANSAMKLADLMLMSLKMGKKEFDVFNELNDEIDGDIDQLWNQKEHKMGLLIIT
jgi:hypothetical protein